MRNNVIIQTMVLSTAMLSLTSVCAFASQVGVFLQVGFDDPEVGHGDPSKNPPVIPVVSIDGHVLTFGTSCNGFLLQLIDENGNTAYSALVTSNTLTLPTTLFGTYKLQLRESNCNYFFYGYINL